MGLDARDVGNILGCFMGGKWSHHAGIGAPLTIHAPGEWEDEDKRGYGCDNNITTGGYA